MRHGVLIAAVECCFDRRIVLKSIRRHDSPDRPTLTHGNASSALSTTTVDHQAATGAAVSAFFSKSRSRVQATATLCVHNFC